MTLSPPSSLHLHAPESAEDYARMAGIVTLVLDDAYTGDDLHRLLRNRALILVAKNEAGLQGYMSGSHHPWNAPGVFAARVYVHPLARGQGVGRLSGRPGQPDFPGSTVLGPTPLSLRPGAFPAWPQELNGRTRLRFSLSSSSQPLFEPGVTLPYPLPENF